MAVRAVSSEAQTALVILAPPEVQAFARHFGNEVERLPAHITLLYPFADPRDLETALKRLRQVCVDVGPFRLHLNRYGRFQSILFLEPSNPEPIHALFLRLKDEFAEYPPYAGVFGPNLRPHLTLASYPTVEALDQITLPPVPSFRFEIEQLHVLIGGDRQDGVWRPVAAIPLVGANTQPPAGDQHAAAIRRMFARIAHRYNRMNRLMTLGQDRRWRREVIWRAALAPGDRVLDLGAGTGDLALESLRQQPRGRVVAVDFTAEMMRLGRSRPAGTQVRWVIADAQHLPFAPETFDAVVSGFLLRNLESLEPALAEQHRVLRPGGRLSALDTTPPAGPLRRLLRLYLQRIVPALGRLVTGEAQAYNYLATSTEQFLSARELSARLEQAGLHDVGFTSRMWRTVAIHWGHKSSVVDGDMGGRPES
ncbi:MAG: ubiquinone/menaquinone biosynthesis methyltransferase [Chloroflexota bacterium]